MKRNHRKGFTLVEMVVVIAIIGILAAILIPTFLHYIKKAQAKVDISSAKQIYTQVKAGLVDDDLRKKFYQHNTTEFDVTCHTKTGGYESYRIVVVAKTDGSANADTGNRGKWYGNNSEASDFVDYLNEQLRFASSDKYISMKFNRHDRCETTRWLICYRKDDKERIEIWAGDPNLVGVYDRNYGDGPCYRVYPDPDEEYTDP